MHLVSILSGKRKLYDLISFCVIVTASVKELAIILKSNLIFNNRLVAMGTTAGESSVKSQYIRDCVNKNELLDIELYR